MDYRTDAELRIQEHFDHIERVNAEGWKPVGIGQSLLITKAIARVLVLLAIRLDRMQVVSMMGEQRSAMLRTR